jgi:hypothetical protein
MLPMNMPLYTRDRDRERSEVGTHLQGAREKNQKGKQ